MYPYDEGFVRIAYCDEKAEYRYDFGVNKKGKIHEYGKSNLNLKEFVAREDVMAAVRAELEEE